MSAIKVNCENIEISNNNKICIIAGPCQLRNRTTCNGYGWKN